MVLQGGQSPFALAGMPLGTSIRPQTQYLKALESSGWYLVSHYSEVLFNNSQFLLVYKPVLFMHLQVWSTKLSILLASFRSYENKHVDVV